MKTEKLEMSWSPAPRGWRGKPRKCMDCKNKPREVKYVFLARGECDAEEYMEDAAPCPEFDPTLKYKLKQLRKKLFGQEENPEK